MDTLIGKTLSHYRIVEKIGAGGMGEVYRARDTRLERDVAIKVLPAGVLTDEDARRRFRREARALAQLSHPHIAVLHDYDTADGVDFLVMELVPGETLAARLAHGALPEPEILRLGVEIAHGIEAAHKRGVLHRDLKPANLLLTPEGDIKILDFGIAHLVRAPEQSVTETVTAAQTLAGTLPYMAPERVLGQPGDARSDIFALGVVLYEMAVGRRPFDDKTPAALAHDIAYTPPLPPRTRRPDLSEGLERVILKAMEKDPQRRYQTAHELGADLEQGTGRVAAPVQGAARQSRRIARVTVAGAAVAFAALLAVLLNVAGLRERLLAPPATAALQSLAVLPLVNLSHDPEQEYFSDGLTTELIGSLAQVTSLRVISHASVMALKGTKQPPEEIARRLGVNHIVEGSVLRVGDRVQVSAELIGISPERVLWAKSFEGAARDLLALQADLSQAIVREIQVRLTPRERRRLAEPRPVDPAAHEAYLRGVYYWARRDSTWVRKAMGYFREAVRIDPAYATGWAGIAQGYYALSNLYMPPNEAMPLARAAAERAISLDPDLSEGHVYLGVVLASFDWKWAEAEREYRRALELNPSSALAHQWYGYALFWQRRLDAAIREYEAAEKIDPLAGDQAGSVAWCQYMAGRYDDAIARFKRLLEADPTNADQHTWLGLCYFRKSMIGPALEELRRGASLSDHAWPRGELAYVEAQVGNRDNAEAILKRLLDPPPGELRNNYSIALTYVALNDHERALEWIEKGYQSRDEDLPFLNVDPAWTPLRNDPRFVSMLKRLGFTA